VVVLLQRSVSEAALVVALDHVILPVADAERSVRFYYQVLGFKYEPVALVRVSPTTVLQLVQRAPETSQHLAFSMSRVEFDRALERLKADGIPFGDNFDTVGTMSGPGKSHGSQKNGDSVYFCDPDSHMLEIICYETSDAQ
jgi:catechol 2,3-dioxygenase-like lactoylglutathione lyase family enzyme